MPNIYEYNVCGRYLVQQLKALIYHMQLQKSFSVMIVYTERVILAVN